MRFTDAIAALSDDVLLTQLSQAVAASNEATAQLVAHIGELDARKLYLREGCASSFTYCTEVLGLSEGAAYKRITVARAARKCPQLLEMLASGQLSLSAAKTLAPCLDEEGHGELLAAAAGKTTRQVQELLAARRPKPDAPELIRKLPARRPKAPVAKTQVASRSPKPAMQPTAPERYRVQLTASRELRDKLRRAQDLLAHAEPGGDLAQVIERAVDLLIHQLEARKLGRTHKPRTHKPEPTRHATSSRYIPAAIRREVSRRDNDRCSFVSQGGRRCSETARLEFHHIEPYARAGTHSVEGLTLRCRAHNHYAAELDFGSEHMRRARGRP